MKRITCILLVICLMLGCTVTAAAATKEDIALHARRLLQYYRHHGSAAEDVVWDILRQMAAEDPNQAAVWENLMNHWAWVNEDMPVSEEVLPDGLPEDESLCIVVMGYSLNDDGSMKEELVDRLVVALASAMKYPNAWIALSGGQTGQAQGVTEAGQMASWLKARGIEEKRLILDKQSLSTTANAVNVYKLLNNSYPQVNSLAVVTSDYHVQWSCAMFTAVSDYNFGYNAGTPLELLAAAVCDTGATADTMLQQAWGIGQITGVGFDESLPAPAIYAVERPTEPQPEPVEETEAAEHHWFWQQEEKEPQPEPETEAVPKKKLPIWPFAVGAALVAAYVLTPKKPRKKRKKPEWNWDV